MTDKTTMSIGSFVRNEVLTSDLTNVEILEKVHKAFPSAKTTMACIAWYKSDMRRKGLLGGGRSQKRLEAIEAELKFLKDKDAIKTKIKELEAQLKELEPTEEEARQEEAKA